MKKKIKSLMILFLLVSIIMPYINVKADGESRVQIVKADSSGNGSFTVSGGPQDGTVNYDSTMNDFFNIGTSITLNATPDNRWTFIGWYNCEEYEVVPGLMGWRTVGDVLSTSVSYTFTVTENYYNIMPVFDTGHNNIWTTEGGTIAVLYENSLRDDQDGTNYSDGDVVDFVIGDTITVKAKANEGFKFVGWYVSNVVQGPEYYDTEKLVSTDLNYVYQPKVTTVVGIDEPINYLTAVFEEDREIKTYTLNDEKGNQIIFTDYEGIVFVFNSTDILNITDEEMQVIADDMGVNIEDIRAMGTQVIEAATNAVKGMGTLVGLYDFSVSDGNGFKEQATGGFKIKIKINDEMKKYNTFYIAYLKDDGNIEEPIKLIQNGDYLEGTIPHLSTYAIIGNNVETIPESTDNPKTGDNIIFYVSILGLSLVGLMGSGLYIKKRIIN